MSEGSGQKGIALMGNTGWKRTGTCRDAERPSFRAAHWQAYSLTGVSVLLVLVLAPESGGMGGVRAAASIVSASFAAARRTAARNSLENTVQETLARVRRSKKASARYNLLSGLARTDAAGLVPILEKAIQRSPRDADLHYALGMAFYYLGETLRGIQAFEKARALSGGDYYIYIRLGSLYERAGEWQKAADLYRKAVKPSAGRNGYYEGRLAVALAQLGQTEEALRIMGDYLKRYPDSDYAHGHASSVYQRLGKFDLAIQHLRRAIALAQKNAREAKYRWQLLTLLSGRGRMAEAEKECKLLLDAAGIGWYRGRARQRLRQLGQVRGIERTIEELEADVEALEKRPDAPAALRVWRLTFIGEVRRDQGRRRLALAAYERALRAAPKDGALRDEVAALKQEIEKTDEDIRALLNARGLLWKRDDPFEKGGAWLGFDGLVVMLNRATGEVTNFSQFADQEKFRPTCIEFDADRVWLGTDHGLFAYDRRYRFWNQYAISRKLLDVRVTGITIEEPGVLLFTVLVAETPKGEAMEERYAFDQQSGVWAKR